MKRAILLLAILLIAHYTQAQVATKLSVADTRDANTLPSGYSQEARFEFKARNAVGVPGEGYYSGMLTIAPWLPDYSGNKFHQLNFNDGGMYYRTAPSGNSPWEAWRKIIVLDSNGDLTLSGNANLSFNKLYGCHLNDSFTFDGGTMPHYGYKWYIYSKVTGAGTFALSGYSGIQLFTGGKLNFYMNSKGNVLIGKEDQINTAYKLDVAGKVRADEITVNTSGADFVFEKDYNLRPLTEVEAFVKENKHLPDVAPAAEMQANGVSVGEMNAKLLQKVEELTLYIIQLNKRVIELENENSQLKKGK